MPKYNVIYEISGTVSINVDAPDEEEAVYAARDAITDEDYTLLDIEPESIIDVEEIEE